MFIQIRLLNGQVQQFDVEPTDKVIDLKIKLEEREAIAPEQQRLIFSGKQLDDNKTFEEQKIGPGTQINLLLSLRGGF